MLNSAARICIQACVGLALVVKHLSGLLVKLGLSGGLASLIGVALKVLMGEIKGILYMDNPGPNPAQDQPFPPAEGGEIPLPSKGQPAAAAEGATPGTQSSSPPSPSTEGSTSTSLIGHASGESNSEPSALEERTNELILENVKKRKADLGDGQGVDEVRQEVEDDFNIETKGELFELVKELDKETKTIYKPSPATNCAFQEIKQHESKIQDGKGGGIPKHSESKEKTDE